MSTSPDIQYRYFLAHSKSDPDPVIDRWRDEVRQLLEVTHGRDAVAVVPGRDDFKARAAGLGGWKPWMESIATGLDWRGVPHFDGIVVPLGYREAVVGKATAEMVDRATAAKKPVYAYTVSDTAFWVVMATVPTESRSWTEWATLGLTPTGEPATEEKPKKAAPRVRPGTAPRRAPAEEGAWETFVEDCDYLIGLCDEVPERGTDFASSVREKAEGMKEWATENRHVTEKMIAAVDRMSEGVAKWIK